MKWRRITLASTTLCLLIVCVCAVTHTARAAGCTLTPPTDPQPGNLDVITADSVTLRWHTNCATVYELHIDDQVPVNLTIPEYTFSPHQGIVNWRVIAFDSDGHHAEGATWRFEVATERWLATPIPISPANLLYQPPSPSIDLGSAAAIILAVALCVLGILLLASRSRTQRS